MHFYTSGTNQLKEKFLKLVHSHLLQKKNGIQPNERGARPLQWILHNPK